VWRWTLQVTTTWASFDHHVGLLNVAWSQWRFCAHNARLWFVNEKLTHDKAIAWVSCIGALELELCLLGRGGGAAAVVRCGLHACL
jgi:hypothetical protein